MKPLTIPVQEFCNLIKTNDLCFCFQKKKHNNGVIRHIIISDKDDPDLLLTFVIEENKIKYTSFLIDVLIKTDSTGVFIKNRESHYNNKADKLLKSF